MQFKILIWGTQDSIITAQTDIIFASKITLNKLKKKNHNYLAVTVNIYIHLYIHIGINIYLLSFNAVTLKYLCY